MRGVWGETEKLWKSAIKILIICGFLIYFSLAREPLTLKAGNSGLIAQQCLIGGVRGAGSHSSICEGGKFPLFVTMMVSPLLSLLPGSITYAASEIQSGLKSVLLFTIPNNTLTNFLVKAIKITILGFPFFLSLR